ncbi:MAG: DinB family protein [Bryobacteraceae bacterium]
MPESLEPELQDYAAQYMRLAEDARSLAQRLDDSRINWTLEPGRWSIGQNLDHLIKVGGIYLPFLRRAIEEGRAKGITANGPFRYGWLGNYLVSLAEPPPRRKFRAPKAMRPEARVVAAEVLVGFLTLQDEMQKVIASADGLDLARVKVRSPITGLVRIPLGRAIALTAAHERRHLWHSWQLRKHREFPDPPADAA